MGLFYDAIKIHKRTAIDLIMNEINNISHENTLIDQAKEALFNYAIDREEIKWLMERLHDEADINRNTVEYELQVLKIISIGWAISYHLEDSLHKAPILTGFWNTIFEFSKELSATTSSMTGTGIDYFQILKDRLDTYIEAISINSHSCATNEPAAAIGPKFAMLCGNSEDLYTHMTGMSMFMTNVCRTGQYLEKMGIKALTV